MTDFNAVHVSALFTYPIKSCGRLAHEQIALDARGPVFDRRWMVVGDSDQERGLFMTQRELPRMALIQPSFGIDSLRVDAAGMATLDIPVIEREGPLIDVTVWNDTLLALDEGDHAAEWVSDFLGAPMRLVRIPKSVVRPVSLKHTNQPAQVGFADGYPLLLASQESLDDLNRRLEARGKDSLSMDRFRPNVVVAGCGPFEEDDWLNITIGAIPLEVCKPCARCVIPTVDQATGAAPDVREPTATLATFRRTSEGKVMFGQNAIHRGLGTLHIGDPVTVQTVKPERMELVRR